ncbi:hypothetical protein GGX14DRAFT_565425 [Mycena pura]|uniref:Jacalin-type lectin domain-containing protein n=1 Tax=Mycena pura TaxID=153505 RepID=A0AAD6VEZ5_9AGAR|nr:hypothetical protein GGX14DRAFT_565423 [Mycena pura]KAJ7210830.1 hypothetical protein GGX14DRAFT_565425 [Mycena pura]
MPILRDIPPLAAITKGDVIDIPGFPGVTVVHAFGEDPNPGRVEVAANAYDQQVHQSPTFGTVTSGKFYDDENPPFTVLGGNLMANEKGVTGIQLDYEAGFQGRTPGSGAGVDTTFKLAQDEYITGFRGTQHEGRISTLVIITNKRHIATAENVAEFVGHEKFAWSVEKGHYIIGFTGTADDYLTSISAFYVAEDPPYNPDLDVVIETRSNFVVCKNSIVNLVRGGDYGRYYDLDNRGSRELQMVYQQISELGDRAWATVSTPEKKQLRVSFIQNVGTVWVYSEDSGPGLNGEAPSAESQHANFGSFAQSSGWTGSNGFLVSHLPPGAVSLVAAIALQKWLNSWFLARATRFLGDAAANLTARLAGEGLLRAGGRVVVRVLGRIALFGAKWLIGPIIGSLIALGLQELWSYLMKEYVLLCRVVNYDAHATYTVTDAYGVNEEITDPDFAASEIPKMDLAGTQRTIPGLPFPITIDENIAYYNNYIVKNSQPFAGGMQVAMGVLKNGSSDGFNFYYRVEKAADNSQALGAPRQSARDFLSNKNAQKTKILSIGGPIPVNMTSPELWHSSDDIYRCDVAIVPPN